MRTKPVATPEAWRSRIVGHGDVDPASLIANPRNWRTHPPEQRAALIAELDRVGFVQSVVVNRTTGLLVDGHLRAEVAVERRVATIPVVYVELTEEEEARVLVALDPLGSMAGTNDALLQALLAEVDLENQALEKHLVSFMASGRRGTTEADDVPPVPDDSAVYVKPGDVWVLGDHRILCGDSTKADDVLRLLDGARPALMVTDPPYGVEYDPQWRADVRPGGHYALGKVTNDDRADWREAWALSPAMVAYVWHAALHSHVVAESLIATGFELRSQIIWRKQELVMGRGHYHWQHEPAWVATKDEGEEPPDHEAEPAWYAVRKGATAGWTGSRKQATVWDISSVHRTAGTSDDAITEQSTQKPVECMARPMRNHRGDVYEPFSGSGTTIIAAETLGRRCYAMELDPRYVQVAITRWQEFTGREATRG